MKKFVLCSIVLFHLTILHSQTNINASHTLFVEGLGDAGYYSINYDKILFLTKKSVYTVRVGMAGWNSEVDINKRGWQFNFPIMINKFGTKDKNHHFEIGTGLVISWGYNGNGIKVVRGVEWGLIEFLGYRYQRPEGGLMIRAGWTPWYAPDEDWFYPLWAGAGIGYTF